MCGVGIAWPTVPGTTLAGWAALGFAGFCAVPAGEGAVADGAEGTEGFRVGALAVVWAAAGVSPAAAKAIAHPISLICTPDSAWNRERGCPPGFAGSIGAGFESLKRLIQLVVRRGVEGVRPAA